MGANDFDVALKKILKNTIKVSRRVVFLRTLLYFFENTPDVPNCIAVVQQIHELYSKYTSCLTKIQLLSPKIQKMYKKATIFNNCINKIIIVF